jgi:hypothetical protein
MGVLNEKRCKIVKLDAFSDKDNDGLTLSSVHPSFNGDTYEEQDNLVQLTTDKVFQRDNFERTISGKGLTNV